MDDGLGDTMVRVEAASGVHTSVSINASNSVQMPSRSNNLDLQKRVAVERTDLPVIFMTGYGDLPMRSKPQEACFYDTEYNY